MPAWDHKASWSPAVYAQYRAYVASTAPAFEKRHEDCADLSIKLLIDFAASRGLPVTFCDVDGYLYISKASGLYRNGSYFGWTWDYHTALFTAIVQRNIQTISLWYYNTDDNPRGPEPGDLLMRLTEIPIWGVNKHHTALVFGAYPSGTPHPKARDNITKFPGSSAAFTQKDTTRYFVETPATEARFDYLNSRGDEKRNAEVIYNASVRTLTSDDFVFRKYNALVLYNWSEWDGTGNPPPYFSDANVSYPFTAYDFGEATGP